MLDIIYDALIDTIKLIPYLFITFLILELIEHKMKNSEKLLSKNRKYGPLFGALLGAIPQCGFSVAASNLYANKVITIGTLVAIFLSTSDEMIPIMISEKFSIIVMLKIVLFKIIVGIIIGYILDLFYKTKLNNHEKEIHNLCEHDNCSCKNNNIIIPSIKHTLKTTFFILIVNLIIDLLIHYIGENNISKFLLNKNIFTYFISSLIGLIPNCASSILLSELYLSKLITIGNLLSGLLTGSGLRILLLFKNNKNIKENIFILSFIYLIGVILGILVDIIL